MAVHVPALCDTSAAARVSAGAYLVSVALERFGGWRYRQAAGCGSVLALAAILSQPPRKDERWIKALYVPHVAFDVARHCLAPPDCRVERSSLTMVRSVMNDKTFRAVHDVAGVILATILAARS